MASTDAPEKCRQRSPPIRTQARKRTHTGSCPACGPPAFLPGMPLHRRRAEPQGCSASGHKVINRHRFFSLPVAAYGDLLRSQATRGSSRNAQGSRICQRCPGQSGRCPVMRDPPPGRRARAGRQSIAGSQTRRKGPEIISQACQPYRPGSSCRLWSVMQSE